MDCYDYVGHVLWQWHVPELWRRFRIRLDRVLAAMAGVTGREFKDLARLAYTKVGEFQARGLIHFHAIVRLDGPDGPTGPPMVALDADNLGAAIRTAAADIRLEVPIPGTHELYRLTWGDQVDTRPIRHGAHRDAPAGDAHPEQVAGYLAKYLTKSTEDFGIDGRVASSHDALRQGASAHAVAIIATAEQLVRDGGEDYQRLRARYATLGYRGHPITKTRRYSTTFKALRKARSLFRARRDTDRADDPYTVREALREADPDDPLPLVTFRGWTYAGSGYLALDAAERALISAAKRPCV